MPLTVGSLFSGIGGFDLGFEQAGFRIVWQCESDEFCQRALRKHWPDVPCYPDVRTLRAADVKPVDVLIGGFPCQDLTAYRHAGVELVRVPGEEKLRVRKSDEDATTDASPEPAKPEPADGE